MDAANPLCRWLFAAGLVAAVGCHSADTVPIPTVRGQVPEPITPTTPAPPAVRGAPITPSGPLAPAAPLAPTIPPGSVVPASPYVPGAPVPGFPVTPGPMGPTVDTASGYSALPAASRAADLLKEGVPQIKVVALVGSSNLVTDQEVIEAVRQHAELMGLDGFVRQTKEKELYAFELRKVIERELVIDDMYAKLKKQGRMSIIEEIKEFAEKASESTVRSIRKDRGIKTDEEFQSWMRAQGLTVQVIRRQIERQIIADEYIRSALKEQTRAAGFAEIRAYYERHPDEFKTDDKVKWLDIFISFNKHGTPQAAYAYADKVRQEAANGADFVALVKVHDNGLAAGANGVGVGSKRGAIQPVDVEPTVWSLKPGEVSRLIETPVGYHIVKVVEREYAGPRTFDAKVQKEIRDKLLKQYRETEYQKLIEELWRKGTVRVIEMPE